MRIRRLNSNKSHPVAPPALRKEASPRLLAGGFDDEETNLVREAGVGSGEVRLPEEGEISLLEEEEGSTGGGETLSKLVLFQIFKTPPSQLVFKSLHGLFFLSVFFFLSVRSFPTVSPISTTTNQNS